MMENGSNSHFSPPPQKRSILSSVKTFDSFDRLLLWHSHTTLYSLKITLNTIISAISWHQIWCQFVRSANHQAFDLAVRKTDFDRSRFHRLRVKKDMNVTNTCARRSPPSRGLAPYF